jgi:acetyl-CoA carboxylase carboxyl transferase subunit beta
VKISEESIYQKQIPFIMISKSGGARMMEAAYSLMQLAKNICKLAQLRKNTLHFTMYRPTTGGTTASYAMLETSIFLNQAP